MAGYSGSALWLQWRYGASGTLQLDTDYRTFSYTPGAEFYEETAGAAATKEYILSMKTGQAQAAGVIQAGSLPLFGTALMEGQLGTLIFCPEGTANGKYHGTIAAYSQGLVHNTQYNQIVEWSCSFMQNGNRTEGTVN